jgi:hypothetical protein
MISLILDGQKQPFILISKFNLWTTLYSKSANTLMSIIENIHFIGNPHQEIYSVDGIMPLISPNSLHSHTISIWLRAM